MIITKTVVLLLCSNVFMCGAVFFVFRR